MNKNPICHFSTTRSRVGLGSSKSANAKLHSWMQVNAMPGGAAAESKKQRRNAKKTHQTKA